MQKNKAVYLWLVACCFCVAAMVLLGGLTRLTDSGLSIMKWEPLAGALPPLSEAKWQEYFAIYKQIPEYIQTNKGMSLEEFKGIFWLEYFHRLMGRVTGLIFLLPFIGFAVRKQLSGKLIRRLATILGLGALQGFVGWYMVSSGFADRTDVSQYRLALHLCMAFVIYALLLWSALDVREEGEVKQHGKCLRRFSYILTGMVMFMVMLGAFVAGTDAGFTYNTFPLMDGKLVPGNLYLQNPWWINHFENITMIQFQHRVFAYILTVAVLVFAWRIRQYKCLATGLAVCLLLQVGLGIGTLELFGHYADYDPVDHAYKKVVHLPVIIAALHQLNALFLLSFALAASHRLAKEA